MGRTKILLAGALLSAVVLAHGDHNEEAGMDMSTKNATAEFRNQYDKEYLLPSYAGLENHSGQMLGHVVFMVLAWFFVLPIGVMFSIARSKLALPVQLLFLALNGIGMVFGTVYNVSTPDLYVHNAHHSIGWIATWIMTAQAIMSLLFVYAGRTKQEKVTSMEQAAFLPATLRGLDQIDGRPYGDYRWSADSGHATVVGSPSSQSRDLSPSDSVRADYVKPEQGSEEDEDMPTLPRRRRSRYFQNTVLDKYLSARVPQLVSTKLVKVMEMIYEVIDRTILLLSFIALTTGGVTYAGIFRGINVFSGLAHFIKGGIFVWYGFVTLGRWMGCFADWGWAWNIKPTRSEVGQRKASMPTAEFTESFLIFLYGSTNVFLEHLAAWGKPWSAQDFEHVSISILFFSGGLFGMLVESKTIRKWLNTSVDAMPTRVEVHPTEAEEIRTPPKTYAHSMNPVPGLIIFLLGIMMSSHHQSSMVSTMVHKQWGTLLCAATFARGLTYVTHYISPPTSVYPSRPPTELITSFCLISGGLIFMASARDPIHYMEEWGLMAMFVFTVAMSLTALLMAYEVFVLSLKGWAVRRDQKLNPRH